MKITFITKKGTQTLDTVKYRITKDSPLFKAVRSLFEEWLAGTNKASEYKMLYYGKSAKYNIDAVVKEAVEGAIKKAEKGGSPRVSFKDFAAFDLEKYFE